MHLRAQIKDPNFLRLYDHWQSIRMERPVPLRADIDPTAIGRSLRYVWLYEYLDEEDTYRCRLAGEHIQEAFKRSMSGLLINQIYSPDIAALVRGYWDKMRNARAIVHGESISPAKDDNTYLRSQRLMLPLASEDGAIRHIFGMTRYDFDTFDFDISTGIDGSHLDIIPCADLED